MSETKEKPTGLALLREPFPPHQISKLPKPTKAQTDAVKADFKKGMRCQVCGSWHHPDVIHLDYVGHAALTDRLLDADPNWSWEPVAFRDGLPAFDESGGLWIKLTVCGVSRYGYGHAAPKNTDPGAREKEVIGDALRNAAMRFGAALDLWHKGDLHADEEAPPERSGDTVVRDMTSTKITPNADAEKNVTTEQKERVRKVATEIIDCFVLGHPEAALVAYDEAMLLTEEKLFLWTLLDSTQRNSLKRLGKEKREKEAQPKAA